MALSSNVWLGAQKVLNQKLFNFTGNMLTHYATPLPFGFEELKWNSGHWNSVLDVKWIQVIVLKLPAFTSSKLTIETLEQCVKYVQS